MKKAFVLAAFFASIIFYSCSESGTCHTCQLGAVATDYCTGELSQDQIDTFEAICKDTGGTWTLKQ